MPTNVIIPARNAGIGDLIYGTRADHIIAARGTANADTIKNKAIYGAIYGFVAGMAMVCAPKDFATTKAWGAFVTGMPTFSGMPLMRNGNRVPTNTPYAQMNTARNSSYITGGSQSPAPAILASAYQATPLSASTFNANATADIKARFGTWEEYIRQTLRVNGVPGTPFGAKTIGIKVHEFGRWMAHTYGKDQAVGTALRDCYDYTGPSNTDPAGTWWLPSMFEIAELMIDDHYNKLNENNNTGWGDITNSASRWSCVAGSGSGAWAYGNNGMSNSYGFSKTFTVRPVTLLKL